MPNPNKHSKAVPDPKSRPIKERKTRYIAYRREGFNIRHAAREAGISPTTAHKLEEDLGLHIAEDEFPEPKMYEELGDKEKRGVDDFLYFCTHFLKDQKDQNGGFLKAPPFWKEIAAHLSSEDNDKVIITVQPGVGKTWCICAYITWRITRERALGNRSYSVLYGSATQQLVGEAVQLIKNWMSDEHLIKSFGRYKPTSDDETKTWAERSLIVAGMGLGKGKTLTAWTITAHIRGTRPNLNIWDDPQKTNIVSDPTETAKIVEKWDSEIEDRTEPGGKTAVVGTYAGPVDLQHELISRRWTDELGEEHIVWKQIKFPAHDESRCGGKGNHQQYPEGCLLWPERWGYDYFHRLSQNSNLIYRLQYQLEDIPAGEVLVPRLWIEGGTSGVEMFQGCLNYERDLWQVPKNLSPNAVAIATIDPSQTQWSSWQMWIWDDPTDYLIAFERLRLRSDEEYVQKITEWTRMMRDQFPFDTWIIERTGNRFLLDTNRMRQLWQAIGCVKMEHECVDTETEVLSQRGWLRSNEVQVGEQILTLNTETGFSEWQPVKYVYRGQHNGEMVHIGGRIDALVTPDHRWAVTDFTRKAPLKFVETKDLNTKSVIPMARPLAPTRKAPIYEDDLVELVGWAVTEGHFHHYCPNDTTIGIGQSPTANPANVERIRLTLKRLGVKFRERINDPTRDDHVIVFKFSGEVAKDVRAITGHKKALPIPFLLSLTSEQRRLLLDVLQLGDGWVQGATRHFSTSTESLALGWEVLCALEGIPTTRVVRTDYYDPPHIVLSGKSGKNARPIQTLDNSALGAVEFSGEVWCPNTVNGTFYARRGGKTHFTGNTIGKKQALDTGPWSFRDQYKYGRVDLPFAYGPTQAQMTVFIDEHTRYPFHGTNDSVMGDWFYQYNKKKVTPPARREHLPQRWVPPWIRKQMDKDPYANQR